MPAPGTDLRLNRFLARAGFGSRRSVEELVRQGKVRINGEVVTDLGRRVDPEAEEIPFTLNDINISPDRIGPAADIDPARSSDIETAHAVKELVGR